MKPPSKSGVACKTTRRRFLASMAGSALGMGALPMAASEGGYGAKECTFLDPSAGSTLVDEALENMERLRSQSGKSR